jgi:3-dehydroquinate synthase
MEPIRAREAPLEVRHSAGAYEVRFETLAEALQGLPERSFAITDDNVRAAWGRKLPAGWSVRSVPPGEASKSLERLGECLSWLARSGADRQSTLVAFGGGVVGDLAGFAAAAYMRGIRLVQMPTSLLAQVDSSVGGKVAVDLPEGKNLAGAFYPPASVHICIETLSTLPWREFVNGMAEVWKYGFILDAELARAMRHLELQPDSPRLPSIVRRCVELKAAIVEEDEHDTSGRRAILNFGHTVGHALERVTEYGALHGEAVAVGMAVEARLGELLGVSEKGTAEEVESTLEYAGLPIRHEALSHPDLVPAMLGDKKTERGELAFSLLTKVGECKLVRAVPRAEVEAALRAL